MLTFFLSILFAAPVALCASQASSLIASAHQLPPGTYKVRNVGTGQYLTGGARNLYAGKGTPTKISVVPHDQESARHTVMGMGHTGNTKCVSAAWSYSEGANGSGSLYSCQLGSLSKGNRRTSLRADKQAFILVAAASNRKRDLEDDEPVEEVVTVEEDATDSDLNIFEKRARRRPHRHASKHHGRKKSKKMSKRPRGHKYITTKGGGYGPYYIMPTDHINDQKPRALDATPTVAMSQRVMSIKAWQKGNTRQQWVFERA